MKYILVAVTTFLLAIVHVSTMSYFSILGVTPDIILVFASCWVAIRHFREGLVVVPIAALCRDLLTSDPLGLSLIALAPIVVLAMAGKIAAPESRFLVALGTVVFGSLSYSIIGTIVLAATGQDVPLLSALLRAVMLPAVVNALVALVLYLPLYWVITGSPRWLSSLGSAPR